MKRKLLLLIAIVLSMAINLMAADVSVTITMNNVSQTMSLKEKATQTLIEVGSPTSYVYTFNIAPGTYTLTAFASDGTTENGQIDLTITETAEQSFSIYTVTAYATNSGWTYGTDYTIEHKVTNAENANCTGTLGTSISEGMKTFLAFSGNEHLIKFIPSDTRKTEGYVTNYDAATVSSNITASKEIPIGVAVSVKMNAVSRTMTLKEKTTQGEVEVGSPTSYVYTFNAAPGTYTLTAFALDGTTENGQIELTITEDTDQSFIIYTITSYATNSGWTYGTDYTIEHTVVSREGADHTGTLGSSTTSGRKTFLVFSGNTYYVKLVPSDTRKAEGYMTYNRSATITGNVNASGKIPMGYVHYITVPKEATLFVGTKTAHFIKFPEFAYDSVTTVGDNSIYYYRFAENQVYNYRVSQTGKLTQGGYFTIAADATKRPDLTITTADLEAYSPKTVDHDVKSNSGLNVGDIFLNINERGHLKMNMGDTHQMIACRTWQLTDNSTNNYFIEPDFHYSIVNANGEADNSVITIDGNQKITAVGNGTVIVLVTYDAINLNYFSGTNKNAYMGGPFWGAIWPENTGTFMVTVGDLASNITPNIKINEEYNLDTKKVAGEAVDAEHDVFYYLPADGGFSYTFSPQNVTSVTIAYPTIGVNSSSYTGFGTEGVTANQDGSYTVRLKFGRNIVKMTNALGISDYQIFTAKPTSYEITNGTNPGEPFQPGDQINVQFSGLFHPANKLAGIYNMSAYVTYNNTPNGTSLILGSGQYTFGSATSAQLVKVTIPENWNIDSSSVYSFSDGVIQVNGYGDPIGNHRNTSPIFGRSPNFTAIAHKTYFGALPSIAVNLQPTEYHWVKFINQPNAAVATVLNSAGDTIKADDNSYLKQSFGTYNYTIICDGYKILRNSYKISSTSPDTATIAVEMVAIPTNGWDGVSTNEPTRVSADESNTVDGPFEGMEGFYKISNGYELAWFASHINSGNYTGSAILINDIDLCNFSWTIIGGTSASKAFQGVFDGAEHCVTGLYIQSTSTYNGLFGYIKLATVRNLTVEGTITSTSNYTAGIVAYADSSTITNCHNKATVSGKQYTAGIVSYIRTKAIINSCSNTASISGTSSNAAGICGYLSTNDTVYNSFNTGNITAYTYAGGIVGALKYISTADINSCYNTGTVSTLSATSYIGSIKGDYRYASVHNSYTNARFDDTDTLAKTKTAAQFGSGEVAWLLGSAYGQKIGQQALPILNGTRVYKVNYTNNLDALTDSIFTNGSLPIITKDRKYGTWYTGSNGTPISNVTSDTSLYIMFDTYSSEFSQTACDSYTWNGQTYTTSNDYVQTLTSVNGCDSTVTLHLTINNAVENEFSHTACNSYTWNGQTYTTSNDYVQTLQTVNGCDSTVTLHLTVNHSNLVEISDSVKQGDTYTLNGFSISANQTQEIGSFEFNLNLQNVSGCDSTVVLTLNVYQPTAINSAITSNINLYPNPTSSLLNVTGVASYERYEVISTIGNVVANDTIYTDELQISTSTLNVGIYYVRLYGTSATITKKFVVKR